MQNEQAGKFPDKVIYSTLEKLSLAYFTNVKWNLGYFLLIPLKIIKLSCFFKLAWGNHV